MYIIIGAGSFGLNTALQLRKYTKSKIIIIDKNNDLSASKNGGNGFITEIKPPSDLFSFKKYKSNLYIEKFVNKSWVFYFIINNLINNNRKRLNEILLSDRKLICQKSAFVKKDHWTTLEEQCKEKGIDIINNIEVVDWKRKKGKIKVYSKKYVFTCDKLILCTGFKLNLVKNKYYHKFINNISGISVILTVKNQPKCYYYSNGFFITPYETDKIKITCHMEYGLENPEPKYIVGEEYNAVVDYVLSHNEIKKYDVVNTGKIWRGTRALTYDMIPFFTSIDKNVYWFSGGGFVGSSMSRVFSKWFVEYLFGIRQFKIVEPTIYRLEKSIRNIKISIIIIMITMFLYRVYK